MRTSTLFISIQVSINWDSILLEVEGQRGKEFLTEGEIKETQKKEDLTLGLAAVL